MVAVKPDPDLKPCPVTCPHCGIECAPFMWPDDWAVVVCGYCGKLMRVTRLNGDTKVSKA